MIKKIVKLLFSRLFITIVVFLAQMGLVLASIYWFGNYNILFVTFEVFSVIIAIWILSHDIPPEYKAIWASLVLAFPLFGWVFYLLFGKRKLNKKKLVAISRQLSLNSQYYNDSAEIYKEAKNNLKEFDDVCYRQSNYIEHNAYAPVMQNTKVKYYPIGDLFYPEFLEDLKKARKFIFLEYFIINTKGEMWPTILSILRQKAEEGVEIKMMYDDFGSITTVPPNYEKTIRSYGIECIAFNHFRPHLNPEFNYRDHRKITVIDGNIAYSGGLNFADEYINRCNRFGHWKDNAIRLEGLGVFSYTKMFMNMWNFANNSSAGYDAYVPEYICESDGFVQPFGDNPLDSENISESLYIQIIHSAKDYVYITTPYLVLDSTMINALCTAAKCGVDVRIVTPFIPDKWYVLEVSRSYYNELISAGVKIYEYTPGFIHSKMFVCDDRISVIGTINMDYRSFYLHFECGTVFYDSSVIPEVRKDMMNIFDVSRRISTADVNPFREILRRIIRLFAPML